MSAFPTALHLGPLTFHLYGLGLAIAAFVAYGYAERRLRHADIPLSPFARFTAVLVVTGLLGARLANVATNWSYYSGHPGRWLAVWQGGLASFGGIALALPAGLWAQRRLWPTVSRARFTDALVPALVAGWALGRVLGPQFMINGGGHLTHQWFGMYYHGQVGKRVPVPLLQGAEDTLLWLGLLAAEARWTRRPAGAITALAMVVWGLVRAYDERWLLGEQSHSGSIGVQVAGLALSAAGVVLGWRVLRRRAALG